MIVAQHLPAIIGVPCPVEGKVALWVGLASMTIAQHLPTIIGGQCAVEGKAAVWAGLVLHGCCPIPTSHHRWTVCCRRQGYGVGWTS